MHPPFIAITRSASAGVATCRPPVIQIARPRASIEANLFNVSPPPHFDVRVADIPHVVTATNVVDDYVGGTVSGDGCGDVSDDIVRMDDRVE